MCSVATMPSIHSSWRRLSSPTLTRRLRPRPCLILRHDTTDSGSSSDDEPQPSSRLKKKVVFADDRGLSLTQVRMMAEPSYLPPSWSSQFLRLVTQGVNTEVAPDPWECAFSQPASDYLEFRRRLNDNFVSLENVIVKESEKCIVGTVKVKNIAFEKEVIIRSSVDCWMTKEDTFCTYVKNTTPAVLGSVKVIYDTFSFQLSLPCKSREVEFCVCYRCEGQEYWDSNNGKNYTIVKKPPGGQSLLLEPTPTLSRRFSDIASAKMDSWSEFASWNNLANDGPYW